MAQHLRLQVPLTPVRVHQRAIRRLGHGIDGQIAPGEVFFQRHIRRRVYRESAIAGPYLTLGPRQGDLLMGLGVEEHGKILADRQVTRIQQGLRVRADGDPIPVLHRQTQQGVADGAADQIHLHTHVAVQHPQQWG